MDTKDGNLLTVYPVSICFAGKRLCSNPDGQNKGMFTIPG